MSLSASLKVTRDPEHESETNSREAPRLRQGRRALRGPARPVRALSFTITRGRHSMAERSSSAPKTRMSRLQHLPPRTRSQSKP
eukprot:106333-Prymnesium_polylepis.1